MELIAPFYKFDAFGYEVNLALGFVIGFFFGMALEKAGFGNARKLTAQFYLYDMRVFKVMFTAVVVAMVLLTVTGEINLLDYDLLFINPTYLYPQMLGALLLGMGFVVGGYCPGTSVVAVASGKIDGMVYVLGFFFGLFLFPNFFEEIQGFYTSGSMGKLLLTDITGLSRTPLVAIIAISAILLFFGATKVEKWAKKKWGYKEIQ